MPEPTPVQEIIIVRRRGYSDGDGHHGGVWKIAFADFMTAMMAFFLVLWIVNSTSKETRSSIARYFNPIKLSETTPARKGLHDPKEADFDASGTSPQAKSKTKAEKDLPTSASSDEPEKPPPGSKQNGAEDAGKAEASKPAGAKTPSSARTEPVGRLRPPVYTEAKLFEDPYAVLAEIVAKEDNGSAPSQADAGEREAKTETPFRDPFAAIAPAAAPRRGPARKTDDEPHAATAPAEARPLEATAASATGPDAPAQSPALDPAPIVSPATAALKALAPLRAEADRLGAEIAEALRGEGLGAVAPAIEVKPSEEGLLVSLTDRLDFGMFAIGSAEPQARTVRVIETIAKTLNTHQGPVIVRGHTDTRPFRSGTSDNWRLSSARAQMAFYILVRGGMDEKRIDRIEGHADRHLKNPKQPEGPENRRIEIVIRKEAR